MKKNLRSVATALAITDETPASWTASELSKLLRLGLASDTPEGVACLQKHGRICKARDAQRKTDEAASLRWAAAVGSAA